jgi:SAM-dependent methyltransferase
VSWHQLGDWWISELAADPAYEEIVTPLLLAVLDPQPEKTYLDLGAGEGRVMRSVRATGAVVHGIEINPDLACREKGMIVASLPQIPVRSRSYDGAYTVLSLEHIADHQAFFAETARVVRQSGVLALIANHPVWTAPHSTPITDTDGEVLWRPGAYFREGRSEIPAGYGEVVFHHRSMSELINSAAATGWLLEHMVEMPHHELKDQSGIPRLLGCRWRLGLGSPSSAGSVG